MSSFLVFVIDATIKAVLMMAALLTGFAYTTLLERRFIARIQQRVGPDRAGPWGLLQPLADGIKVIFKEDIIPNGADRVVFTLAPALTAIPALIILAVVPLGGNVNLFGYQTSLRLTDINVGVLYILAVTSISVYGITLAGWSSANKYAMMGSLRATAQMISYEIAMGLAILAPIMMVGSMNMGDIIDAQKHIWLLVYQPVAGIIFIITMYAETNRAPFDLPEAEQELTAGFHTEYSGMKFATFYMAEYMKMIGVSVIATALFFGGYRLFGLENLLGGWMGPIILIGKVMLSLLTFVWIRATLPRVRYDQLMAFGWKVLLPISLANAVVTAVLIVANPWWYRLT